MGKVHRPIGPGEIPIAVLEVGENRLIAVGLPRSLQNIHQHLIHPVKVTRKSVEGEHRGSPVRILGIEGMHLPLHSHMCLQQGLQGHEGRRPPRTTSCRKRPHIVRAGRQHVRLIQGDKPFRRRHASPHQFTVQCLQHLPHEGGENLGSFLIQPWISSQPAWSSEVGESHQRLQIPGSQGLDHIDIPIQHRLQNFCLGTTRLKPCPFDTQSVSG